MSPGPFEDTAQVDVKAVRQAEVTRLKRKFPDVAVWFGHFTREWWAYLPDPPSHQARLLEAANPDRLVDQIESELAEGGTAI